jgi:beta-xylosidase/AraC-like DNA-binding protein
MYVLNGSVRFDAVSKHFELTNDQLVLFNPLEVYSVSFGAGGVLLEVSIDMQALDADTAGRHLRFLCNSHIVDNEEGYQRIRQVLAQLVKLINNGGDFAELALRSQVYKLLYILSNYFPNETKPDTGRPRIIEILDYLNEHYAERVTLKSVAERFYLSMAYMSRLIKQNLGVNFIEYLNSIRVSRSVAALENGKLSLTQLAEQSGFANVQAYKTAFSHKFGVPPMEYRRRSKEKKHSILDPSPLSSNYLSGLAKYLDTSSAVSTGAGGLPMSIMHIPVTDASQKGTSFGNMHRKMTAIGRASQLLDANNQTFLRELQKDIGFEYIKFHGLLDDDMMVYHENAEGKEAYNFSYIDTAFDFLTEIQLKPFLQLCFMPGKLAQNTDRVTFMGNSVISLPKSIEKWRRLIVSLFKHLIERYGKVAVLEWPVYVWNLPENPRFIFGIADKQAFFNFYCETYRAVKSVCPDIKIGTPSLLCEAAGNSKWFDAFMKHCREQNTVPEFLCVNAFAVEPADKSNVLSGMAGLVKSSDPDFVGKQLFNMRKALKAKQYRFNKIYVIEWNLSLVREDVYELLNDMAFKAVYIVKTLLDNHDAVNCMCHWTFSDSLREVWSSGQVFHGGSGLFTYNGIKKSAYYAFVLLAALRPQVLNRGEGFIVTKRDEDGSFAVLLYNYQHFSPLYASGEMFDMTSTNRYTPFDYSKSKRYELTICQLLSGAYTQTETILNRHYGSAFDKWLEYSQEQSMTAEDVRYIKAASIPRKQKKTVTAIDGILSLSFVLEPHEVRLIELTP